MKLRELIVYASLTSMLSTGCNLFDVSKAEFHKIENGYRAKIAQTSPYVQTPITAPLQENNDQSWYSGYPFVPIGNNEVVYADNGAFYKARADDFTTSKKIFDAPELKGKYLFAVDMDNSGNREIFWIDHKDNVRHLKPENGSYVDAGIVKSLTAYFKSLPKHMALGNVNGDSTVDVVYVSKVKIAGKKRNAIKVLTEKAGTNKEERDVVYYLGNNNLEGMLLRDVDGDNDDDILFKKKDNDTTLYALENKTIAGSFSFAFEKALKDAIAMRSGKLGGVNKTGSDSYVNNDDFFTNYLFINWLLNDDRYYERDYDDDYMHSSSNYGGSSNYGTGVSYGDEEDGYSNEGSSSMYDYESDYGEESDYGTAGSDYYDDGNSDYDASDYGDYDNSDNSSGDYDNGSSDDGSDYGSDYGNDASDYGSDGSSDFGSDAGSDVGSDAGDAGGDAGGDYGGDYGGGN